MNKLEDNIVVEILEPSPYLWESFRDNIVSIESENFGENRFSDEDLKEDFINKNNTLSVLKLLDTGEIIGFTYARPENKDTAFIWNTAIKKEFQNKGLIGLLMNSLEDELKKKGYKYIEREASVENNYTEKIKKHYGGRILKQGEPHDSKFGRQIFFRIKL